MKILIKTLAAAGLLLGLATAPALAQGSVPGTGGAKEQGFPSTVGVDQRPDRETMKARRPTMSAIQADRGSRMYRRGHAHRHHRHMRHHRHGMM